MRTAVFILLPWLLLLPLSWSLDLSSCGPQKILLDLTHVDGIHKQWCQGNWTQNNKTMFWKLKGFVRLVADECYTKYSKESEKAAQCTINTIYNRQCGPYKVRESVPPEFPQPNLPDKLTQPFELVCEYHKEKQGRKTHEDLNNCQEFHFKCQEKLHNKVSVTEDMCNHKDGDLSIKSSLNCPGANEISQFVRMTTENCSAIHDSNQVNVHRRCLFDTIYNICSKSKKIGDRKKAMELVCQNLNPKSNYCNGFSEKCFDKYQPSTTVAPTSPPTSPTTQKTEKTTATTRTTTTAKPITQTNTSDIRSSTGSPSTASTTASPSPATTSTKSSTAAPNVTEASTTQTKTEPTTTSVASTTTARSTTLTASTTAKPTTKSETKTTAQAPPSSTTAKTSTEATTPSPTTTVLSNSPSTTKTTTSPTASGDLSGGQTRPNGPAPPKQSKKETTTETPPDEAEDAQRHGSGEKGSKADNKEEEETNLTPLWVILGIFAVVLVVAGIVVGVIVRKKWKKKKAEKEGNSKSKSNAPPKKSNKSSKPSRAVVPKGQKKTVAANAKPPTAKETEEQMVMQGGSNDGFKREGPLTMDVGIHKGEVVEHVTKEDDGHVLQTVVIDETMNNMFDIGSDIEHVVTDEGAEDGGGGAPKEKKPEDQKSAKSGLKSAVKSSAGT